MSTPGVCLFEWRKLEIYFLRGRARKNTEMIENTSLQEIGIWITTDPTEKEEIKKWCKERKETIALHELFSVYVPSPRWMYGFTSTEPGKWNLETNTIDYFRRKDRKGTLRIQHWKEWKWEWNLQKILE